MIKVKNSSRIQNLAASLIVVVLTVFVLSVLKDILMPLIFAGILSFFLLPICEFLERKKFPRVLAIILSILLAAIILGSFIYFSYTQIIQLESLIPIMIDKGTILLGQIEEIGHKTFKLNKFQLLQKGQQYLTEILKNVPTLLGNTLGTTSNFLLNLSILPLYIFLFLLYRDFLKAFVFKVFRNGNKHKISVVLQKINDVVRNYLVGLILVILIIGALNTISLLALGIEHAVFLGFFAGILVLIPYIGIAIGATIPIFIALITKDSYWYPLGVAIAFAAIQFLEGNFITPYIVGSKVSINSLAAIIVLLLFSSLWGVAGLVLALPLTAILKVIFDSNEDLKAWGFLLGDSDDLD